MGKRLLYLLSLRFSPALVGSSESFNHCSILSLGPKSSALSPLEGLVSLRVALRDLRCPVTASSERGPKPDVRPDPRPTSPETVDGRERRRRDGKRPRPGHPRNRLHDGRVLPPETEGGDQGGGRTGTENFLNPDRRLRPSLNPLYPDHVSRVESRLQLKVGSCPRCRLLTKTYVFLKLGPNH